MKVTLLGCGGSSGVPLANGTPGGYWGNCDPLEPKNRRMRASAFVETQGKRILIDTSPDLREQILRFGIQGVDAVLFTHSHADHCHGIDELRVMRYAQQNSIPAYMDSVTHQELTARFAYAFESSHKDHALYPALMSDRSFAGPFDAVGVPVVPFKQDHGNVHSMGFRIGDFAYSTDVVQLSDEAIEILQGLDFWIVDCLRFEPHPTHAHFDRTMAWIEAVRPKRAVLTHLNHSVDYHVIKERCPPGVEPGYDGLVLEVAEAATGQGAEQGPNLADDGAALYSASQKLSGR